MFDDEFRIDVIRFGYGPDMVRVTHLQTGWSESIKHESQYLAKEIAMSRLQQRLQKREDHLYQVALMNALKYAQAQKEG